MTAYQAISCVQHEQLEFAVLKRRHLQICYVDEQLQNVHADILPLDVYTADAAEWLKLTHLDGRVETVRLDKLFSFKELS